MKVPREKCNVLLGQTSIKLSPNIFICKAEKDLVLLAKNNGVLMVWRHHLHHPASQDLIFVFHVKIVISGIIAVQKYRSVH